LLLIQKVCGSNPREDTSVTFSELPLAFRNSAWKWATSVFCFFEITLRSYVGWLFRPSNPKNSRVSVSEQAHRPLIVVWNRCDKFGIYCRTLGVLVNSSLT
jgi:hypothetical protein